MTSAMIQTPRRLFPSYRSPVKEKNHGLIFSFDEPDNTSNVLEKDLEYIAHTFDEPDNKTNVLPVLPNKVMNNDIHRSELERLKTFEHWPLDYIDKHQLAQTGMYYTRTSDKVKCHFCGVEIGRWEVNDDPVDEHIKWSANCPLMRRRATENIPINADVLDRILPPASYDVCGSNEGIQIHHGAHSEGSITFANTQGLPTSYQMEYPEYAVEAARCRSFAEWPRTMKQKPKQLAEAGFFYAGVGDRVNCFTCGGGLKDWDENDEPWEQHAQWLSKCRFLKLIKGQAYIDAVIAKYKLAAEKTEEALIAGTEVEISESGTQTEGQLQSSTNVQKISTTEGKDLLQRSESSSSSTEKKITPEEKLCKICYAAEYNTAFLPCGHVVACAKCASSVTKCPMCRKPFTDVMRVYFS